MTDEPITDQLLAILPLLNRLVAAEVRREAGEETTMPQYRALALLVVQPMTQSALAKERHVSMQSMGELVRVLIERGWVTRTPDPADRRQHMLAATVAGRDHYERAQQLMRRRLGPLMEQLSDQEGTAVKIALPALRRVLLAMKESDDDRQERDCSGEAVQRRGAPGDEGERR